MATSVNSGQAALMQLPPVPDPKNKQQPVTLETCVLPASLQEERKSLKTAESAGIDVFKVSKVSVSVMFNVHVDARET
jgi:hypothetical protein